MERLTYRDKDGFPMMKKRGGFKQEGVERLPEEGVPVLINYIGTNGEVYADGVAVWTECGCFWWEGSLADCEEDVAVPITHWRPLPEGPEEAE